MMSEAAPRPPLAGVTATSLKDGAGSGKTASTAAKKVSSNTVRIEIKLDSRKRNGDNYEFCYPDLLKQAIKNLKMNEAANKTADASAASSGPGVLKPMRDPDDPLAAGQDDAEAKQLADYFEKKYGGAVGGKKKKGQKRKFDFQDYGMGYDETDPFVDNSEACDELMPNNLTTKMGGFYVNTGQLELREVSDAEEEEEEEGGSDGEDEDESSSSSSEMEEDNDNERAKGNNNSKKRRRPVIRDDDDDEDDDDDDDNGKSGDKSASVNGGNQQQQTRPSGSSSSATALLLAKKNKRLKMQQQMSKRKKFLAAAGIEGSPLKGVVKKSSDGGGEGSSGKGGEKKKKTLTVSEMLQRKAMKDASAGAVASPGGSGDNDGGAAAKSTEAQSSASAIMDNVIDSVIQEPFSSATEKGKAASTAAAAAASSASSGDSGPTSPVASTDVVADLPVDVSENLKTVVEKLKAFAAASGVGKGGEGKKKFFTPQINELLLTVENECRSKTMRPGLRTRVYAHLAHHLPCNKETLIKRARNLKASAENEDVDVTTMIERLKAGINAVMPDIQAKYKAECDKAAEAKGNGAGDGTSAPTATSTAAAPRKKFLWRRDMRENFFAIVRGKVKEYLAAGGAGAAASDNGGAADPEAATKVEEFLKEFLEKEIKPLWPKGWMNERVLMKESVSIVSDCLKERGIGSSSGGGSVPLESGNGSSATTSANVIAAVSAVVASAAAAGNRNPAAVGSMNNASSSHTISQMHSAPMNGNSTGVGLMTSAHSRYNNPQLPQPTRPMSSTAAAAKQQQLPLAASTAIPLPYPANDVGLDLSATSTTNRGGGNDGGIIAAAAVSKPNSDFQGLDLTKTSSTSEAEKAVQKSLEFALHQAQSQQHIPMTKASAPSSTSTQRQQGQNNGGSSAQRSVMNSFNGASGGKCGIDKLPQQQHQQKQTDPFPTTLAQQPLSLAQQQQTQQQALAQQQLQKLLSASNLSLSQQQQQNAGPTTNPATAQSLAPNIGPSSRAVVGGKDTPAAVAAAAAAAAVMTSSSAIHSGVSASAATSYSTVATSTAANLSTSKAVPVSWPSGLIPQATAKPQQSRGTYNPFTTSHANLPSAPLIQPNGSKGSSPPSDISANATNQRQQQRDHLPQQQPQQSQRRSPTSDSQGHPMPLPPPEVHRAAPVTSPLKIGAATSPLSLVGGGSNSSNHSPQKSPSLINAGAYSSHSASRQLTPPMPIQPHLSPRTPSPQKTQQQPAHAQPISQKPLIQQQPTLPLAQPIPQKPLQQQQSALPLTQPILSSHAGFLSQQVVQALTPSLSTFAAIGGVPSSSSTSASFSTATSTKSMSAISSSAMNVAAAAPIMTTTTTGKSVVGATCANSPSFSLPRAADVVSSMPVTTVAAAAVQPRKTAASPYLTGGQIGATSSSSAISSSSHRMSVSSSSSSTAVERPSYEITHSLQGGATVATTGYTKGSQSAGALAALSGPVQQQKPHTQKVAFSSSSSPSNAARSTASSMLSQQQHAYRVQAHVQTGSNTQLLKPQQWQQQQQQPKPVQHVNPQVQQAKPAQQQIIPNSASFHQAKLVHQIPAAPVQPQKSSSQPLQKQPAVQVQSKMADPPRVAHPQKIPTSKPIAAQPIAQPIVLTPTSTSSSVITQGATNPQQFLQLVQQQQQSGALQQQGVLQQQQLQQLQLQMLQQQQQNSLAFMQGPYKPK